MMMFVKVSSVIVFIKNVIRNFLIELVNWLIFENYDCFMWYIVLIVWWIDKWFYCDGVK